jgi:molecular chaperone HtpG
LTAVGNNFQVDLGGVVDLLSRHLYSSPRVYLRELVQNSLDALTARTHADPAAPRRVVVTPADVAGDGCLHVSDTGIGLNRADIDDVLATIGRSSKRDALGFSREDFLGQFGIGLLSCFLVTDEVELTTRSMDGDETLRWRGRADGTYTVEAAPDARDEPGTEVRIAPRRGQEDLVAETQVRLLLRAFAAFLPCELVLCGRDGEVPVTGRSFPWEDGRLTGIPRRAAAADLCQDLLGFSPLDTIELSDPQTGTRGFAYVLPMATSRASHRVYGKHMLLSESCDNVLPEWAFFVRAVLNTDHLRPTASRESLYDDEALAGARERLGKQLRRWLGRTAATDPTRMREFLRVHHLGAKAMATRDDEMLAAIAQWFPFETTIGDISLDEFAAAEPLIRYCDSVEDFRQVSPIATAHGLAVVNAGYAYDTEILARLAQARPALETQLMTPGDLLAHFEEVSEAECEAFERFLDVARGALDRAGCRPEVRRFEPSHLHAVLLADRDARLESTRAETQAATEGAWAELLDSVARPDLRPRFVLNAANPSVRRLAQCGDPRLQTLAVEALYAHALVMGHHPLRPFDTALVSRALPTLIDTALDRGDIDDR